MKRIKCWSLLGLILALVSGCAATPAPTYYRLSGAASGDAHAQAAVVAARQEPIGIWPVQLPDELQRAEIVSYSGSAEVLMSVRHMWAGSLQDNVDRALYSALREQGEASFWRYPWDGHPPPKNQLRVRIQQLGGALGQQVVLEAEWTLQQVSVGSQRQPGRVRITEPVTEAGYSGYVQAINRSITALAAAVAANLL